MASISSVVLTKPDVAAGETDFRVAVEIAWHADELMLNLEYSVRAAVYEVDFGTLSTIVLPTGNDSVRDWSSKDPPTDTRMLEFPGIRIRPKDAANPVTVVLAQKNTKFIKGSVAAALANETETPAAFEFQAIATVIPSICPTTNVSGTLVVPCADIP